VLLRRALLRTWRWRRRRRLARTTRSHTWAHAGAAGTHAGSGHHSGTAGSAGREARCPRPTRNDNPSPGSGRRTTRGEHAVVLVAIAVAVSRDRGTREEDDRHHKNDSGDDHYPRRDLVKPAGPSQGGRRCRMVWRTGWWRSRSGRRRRRRRFRCFGHALIMPSGRSAVHGSAMKIVYAGHEKSKLRPTGSVVLAAAQECANGKQDGRDDEHDPGDDRDPRRDLEEPFGLFVRRRDRWCRGGSRRDRGSWCFTHASHHALARHQPQRRSRHEIAVTVVRSARTSTNNQRTNLNRSKPGALRAPGCGYGRLP
jgi:hypothetical protein